MKFNHRQNHAEVDSSEVDGLAADSDTELRALRNRRHRLRSDELREPRLASHDGPQPVQHAQEQRHALLLQAAVANHAQCAQERERREYVRRNNGMSIALNTNSPTASSTAWKTATVSGEQQRQHLSARARLPGARSCRNSP